MTARRLLLPILAFAVLACSEQGPEPNPLRREVAENRALWEAQGLVSYVYEVARSCFCAPEGVGPVRVRVEGGAVVGRVYVDSGEAVAAGLAGVFPSVDGLFDVLERAIDQGAADVRVTWEEATGLPLEFFIDYVAELADEEEGYRIVDGPRTTP